MYDSAPMEHNTAFVFPGQGSQYAGMGKDVAAAFPAARRVFDDIDAALGFSISQLCFEGPDDQLKLTENTQPAILAVSSAIHAVLEEELGLARRDLVAGHSLGEYSAIVSVGGLTPAEAAKIVHFRGKFMQEAVPVGTGGMAALIGPTVEEAQEICDEAAQGDVLSVANINSPGQVVIAGTAAGIERAIGVAKAKGRKAIPLEVSAPFHCALMKPAEERLKPLLDDAQFKDLWVSLVSNVDASPIGTPTAVRNALIRQVVSPVRWVDSVQKMIAMGVRRFVEVGPKNVLTGMIKRIDKSVELINVSDVASIEAYAARVSS
jgi:[acyl-carrier-protein] S-malonyltransferase